MTEMIATWGPSIGSAIALGLSVLSFGYSLRTRHRAEAKARRIARATTNRLNADNWHAIEGAILREIANSKAQARPSIAIARTGGEPDLADAA